eukprot:scaffold227966_cov25-Prasinocladus_malaysianus.AAC.1
MYNLKRLLPRTAQALPPQIAPRPARVRKRRGQKAIMCKPAAGRRNMQMRNRRMQRTPGMGAADSASVTDSKDEDEDADERLWKNLMMVTTKDFREASFPRVPLQMADARRKKFLSSASKFVSPREAQTDTIDPKQWGSWYYDGANNALRQENSASHLSPTRLSQTVGSVLATCRLRFWT